MQSGRPIAPAMPGYIVVGGRQVPCAVPVEQWQSHGCTFPGAKPRTRKTRLAVLHWTGGEGGLEQVHKTLRDAGTSVQFFVDNHGHAYQLCDADMECAHASGMNAFGPGVEVANRASDEADRVPKRPLLKERFAGSDAVYTSFLPDQVKAVHALVASLCEAYGIPLDVPRDSTTGDVLARQFTPAELAAYTGIVGHCHWSPKRKRDPGLALLRSVAAIGPRGAIGLGRPV